MVALTLGWRSFTPSRDADLTGADLIWHQYIGDGGITSDHGYQMHLSQPDQRAWAVADQQVTDFDLELETRSVASTPDVGYGVLFRYQDAENFYRFAIGSDGYYSIAIVQEGRLTPLHTWQQWPHVRRGDATNRLRVRCEDALCRFYVNGEFTAEFSDDAFLAGHVGLWAQNFTNSSLTVIFDHIRLWSLK
jgi:hypothetical protein